MHYMVAMVTGFLKKYDEMILRCFIYYCGKFQTDTINQTVFGKRICKTSLGKMKTISSHLKQLQSKIHKISSNRADFHENPSMRANETISKPRAGKLSSNFCKQFEERSNFVSTLRNPSLKVCFFFSLFMKLFRRQSFCEAREISKRIKCFSPTLYPRNLKAQHLPHIFNWSSRQTWEWKSQD